MINKIIFQSGHHYQSIALTLEYVSSWMNPVNLPTPIINLIKCLSVAACFTLAAPVFADTKQDLIDACSSEIRAEDYDSAFPLCVKVAEQGDADAQLNLGFAHDFGEGTIKDSILAYAWYNVSASQGNEQATKNRGLIEKEMTPNQIAEAQKLSKELYSKYVK